MLSGSAFARVLRLEIADNYLFGCASFGGVSVDVSFGVYSFDLVATVEFVKKSVFGVGVADYPSCALCVEMVAKVAQSGLLIVVKSALCVAVEACSLANWFVWWIEIKKRIF